MNARLKLLVQRRAKGFCEYCRLHQDFDFLPHHVDHIIARKHRGPSHEGNLCLACANCSLAKGSNISGLDIKSGRMTRLFNPRTDKWPNHFRWKGARLVGRTAIGRTTVFVLNINQPDRVALRQELLAEKCFPPADDS